MAPSSPLSPDSPPTSIDPYEILSIPPTASADEIKSAYRKAALKHHPDKASPENKAAAHSTFQSIAFAYSILSSPVRKARYDATGSTADNDDVDFNWVEFYRSQFAEIISADSIEKFKSTYQGSEEERGDLLDAYTEHEGDMDAIFETVMLSHPIEDEERFRGIIDDAINAGEVPKFKAYVGESKAKRKRRVEKAKREEKEARELARELGVEEKLFDGDGGKKKGKEKKKDDEEGLKALIQQRMKDRSDGFLDSLEEKYTRIENERKRSRKGRGKKRKASLVDDDDDEEEEDGLEKEEEEQVPNPSSSSSKQKHKKTQQQEGRASKRAKKRKVSSVVEDDEEEEVKVEVEVEFNDDGASEEDWEEAAADEADEEDEEDEEEQVLQPKPSSSSKHKHKSTKTKTTTRTGGGAVGGASGGGGRQPMRASKRKAKKT